MAFKLSAGGGGQPGNVDIDGNMTIGWSWHGVASFFEDAAMNRTVAARNHELGIRRLLYTLSVALHRDRNGTTSASVSRRGNLKPNREGE